MIMREPVSSLSSRRPRAAWIAPLVALVLCACAGSRDEKPPEANIVPPNYKNEILSYVHTTLDDPTNIRDAFMSEPALRPSGAETRYIVCLRYNAKDRTGQYGGNKERAAYFYGGRLTTIEDATKEQCGKAAYQPFPELQKLCREVVCPTR
jgi:hypothetical protein